MLSSSGKGSNELLIKMPVSLNEITEDGTLIYGVIEGCSPDILKEAGVLEDTYAVIDDTIETAPWLVSALAEDIQKNGGSSCIIERYPHEERNGG